MESKKRNRINSLFFLFLGHGIHVNGQDCLVGSTGEVTTVSSVKQELDKLNADKFFVVIDACREEPEGVKFNLNKEHKPKYESYLESNFIIVYAAQKRWVAPDIPGNTLT